MNKQPNVVTSADLMAMFPDVITGYELPLEFVFDDGGFAVYMRGYYTASEMTAVQAEVVSMNRVFAQCSRIPAEREALMQQNASLALCEAEGIPMTVEWLQELIEAAQSVEVDCHDYRAHFRLPADMILVNYPDGVWITDTCNTCDLNEMAPLVRLTRSK